MYTIEAIRNKRMLALIQDGRRIKDGFLVENTAFAPEIVAGDLSDECFDAKIRHYFDSGHPYVLAETMKGEKISLIPMRYAQKRAEVFGADMFWDIKAGIWTWN